MHKKSKYKHKNKKKYLIFFVFFSLITYSTILTMIHFELFVFYKPKIVISDEATNKFFEQQIVKISRNYLNDDIKLKTYSWAKFSISEEWKDIINNVRNLHKISNLIDSSLLDNNLCAGYIWILSEKLWWNISPYHIWMMNLKTRKPSKAWELPNYYVAYGWEESIYLWDKFSLENLDYWDNIKYEDLKNFFSLAFSEEALLWDIWLLFKDTKYTDFLKNWSYNSHIAKNMWLSQFKIKLKSEYIEQNHKKIVSDAFECSDGFINDYLDILEYYSLYLNWEKIVLYEWDFYFIKSNNVLKEKVVFKYLDEITYKDITLTHFFDKSSRVDSLFNLVCKQEFYPINVININPKLIEKM